MRRNATSEVVLPHPTQIPTRSAYPKPTHVRMPLDPPFQPHPPLNFAPLFNPRLSYYPKTSRAWMTRDTHCPLVPLLDRPARTRTRSLC